MRILTLKMGKKKRAGKGKTQSDHVTDVAQFVSQSGHSIVFKRGDIDSLPKQRPLRLTHVRIQAAADTSAVFFYLNVFNNSTSSLKNPFQAGPFMSTVAGRVHNIRVPPLAALWWPDVESDVPLFELDFLCQSAGDQKWVRGTIQTRWALGKEEIKASCPKVLVGMPKVSANLDTCEGETSSALSSLSISSCEEV